MSGKGNDRALEVLKEYWGYDSFRPKQEDIVRTALEGRDVLAILPTGGGKSVCFQVPAMIRPGIAIVVTPLIALMKDQVQNLTDRGIRALCINAGMDAGKWIRHSTMPFMVISNSCMCRLSVWGRDFSRAMCRR